MIRGRRNARGRKGGKGSQKEREQGGARVEQGRAVEGACKVARIDADEHGADVCVALAGLQRRVSYAQVLDNCGGILVQVTCTRSRR